MAADSAAVDFTAEAAFTAAVVSTEGVDSVAEVVSMAAEGFTADLPAAEGFTAVVGSTAGPPTGNHGGGGAGWGGPNGGGTTAGDGGDHTGAR